MIFGIIWEFKMKLLKKISLLLMAAALAVGISAANINVTRANAATAESEAGIVEKPDVLAEYGNAEYETIDSSRFRRWNGASELSYGQSYYIDRELELRGEADVTLPKNATLLIKSGGRLIVYDESALTVKGKIIVEPGGQMIVSGKLVASPESEIECYGEFSATPKSTLELSCEFFIGNSGAAAFSGVVNVYKQGIFANGGTLTFTKNSIAKVTGRVINGKSGVVFLKGDFSLTMNAAMESHGWLYVYHDTAIAGMLTLGEGSDLYTAYGSRIQYTKSGFLRDYRNGEPEPVEKNAGEYDDYDKMPDKVQWIGIDVSRYQGAIDFERVKAAGVDFVLLRSSIGDGADITTGEDIRFAVNMREAKKAGLMVGAYHYLLGEDVEDALAEARFFIKTISKYELDFPAVLDFEDPWQQDYLTTEERTAMALAFMHEVENAGYYPMLYVNTNWAENYLDMSKLGKYELWLAEWHPKPSYNGRFGIWQYTAYGGVSGIEGDVDLDICTKNYRKIIVNGNYNHLT